MTELEEEGEKGEESQAGKASDNNTQVQSYNFFFLALLVNFCRISTFSV